jgi:curved DNA-binding protein CbpA
VETTVVEQRTQFDMPAPDAPLDAYRALQLMPSAPHDLIEQAYWVLVGRARARGSHSARLGRLNDAYATLINPERRAAYDLEHGLTKLRTRPKIEMPKRPMFGRTPRFTTRLTHYQLLDIDFEAMPEVVDTAYVFHKADIRRSDPKAAYMRALVEDAYATLASAERRAQYDDRVAPRKRAHTEPPAAARVAATEPPPPAPLFPEVKAAPEAVPEHMTRDAAAPVAGAAAPVAPEHKTEPGGVRRWLRDRRAGSEEAAKPAAKSQRALRLEARLDVLEQEHRRLAELGQLGDAPERAPVQEVEGRSRFRFTDGPQAGERVVLADNSLILGASEAADVVLENPDGMIGAGHVRVWKRDDEYILHQLDSFSTTYVNGERLDLRLAILEPGDEIRIGPHTLIFDQAPAAEPAQAASVTVAE